MRGKSPKNKYKHVESVNALFDKISSVAPANSLDGEWLGTLRQTALRKTSGWTITIEAYLHGLAAAGHLSRDELGELRDSLLLCIDGGWREIAYPLAWTACVSAVTITCCFLSIDWRVVSIMFGLTASAGAMWGSQRVWSKRRNPAKQSKWERPFVIGACALLVPMLTALTAFCVVATAQSYSLHRFNVDRTAFAADPQGFPVLRTFAFTNFNVDVVLGNADDSWALTTVNLPGASVASMSISPGYCELNMYRDNIFRSFEPTGKQNKMLWVQGVMMHEFGHCLDGLRDLPKFGEHSVRVYSIAPIDAKGINDLQSYLTATEEDSTKLWREAVADTFAVGYWRLVAPGEADSLAANLRLRRSNAARGDSTHATMCWIDHALKAAPPGSAKDLFAWADHQRSAAQCDIQKPGISRLVKFKNYLSGLTNASGR